MNYKITVCTLICGVILLNSCQKQESNQITPTTKVEKQLNGEEMANQIEDFRSQILSSQKSGETMYFGEALFLLEASFNYFHGFVSEDFISNKN